MLIGSYRSFSCVAPNMLTSACTQANMICLRHPLTPAAAAGLVLAALLVPSIVASAPVDATTSSTLDSGTRAALDKALNEEFAASRMPRACPGSRLACGFRTREAGWRHAELPIWGPADR